MLFCRVSPRGTPSWFSDHGDFTTCQTQDRTRTIESSRLGVVFFSFVLMMWKDSYSFHSSLPLHKVVTHWWACYTMSCKVLGCVEELRRLQNFCSQLVLALCRDSERIRDPSAGVAAAVEDALSLTQAERRRREMQRPVKRLVKRIETL